MKVYGYSDDLIYMEQEDQFLTMTEEILVNEYAQDHTETYITFSDGTKVLMYYGDDGNWRIMTIAEGRNFIGIKSFEERNTYSDMLQMESFNIRDFYKVEQRKVPYYD